MKKSLALSVSTVILFGCISCAGTEKRNIEDDLIAAMIEKCKTVEIKVDRYREVYIIDPTWKRSERGCPIAVMKGWRDGVLFMEKEAEICECKGRRIE